MHHIWPTTLLIALIAACGPSATLPPRRGATAVRRAAPTKCPELELSPKLRQHKKLTRRIRKMVCGLQTCYDAARVKGKGDLKDFDRHVRLSVTIDPGGRVEAVRLSALDVPASLTRCIRSKVMRWDFDIRDDTFTYGPFKIRFAP